MTAPSGPPVAPQEPFEHTEHGVTRPDPYAWMRRLDDPVLAHLTAEREWYDVATGHLGPLVQELRAEMADRVPATDSSVSWPQHGYSYYTVLPAGREYVQLLRRRHGRRTPRSCSSTSTSSSATRLRRPRARGRSPRTHRLLAYCGRLRRRRGLRAALPRPRDRRGPAPTSCRDGAPAGRGRPTRRTSSTSSTTTCGASTRCGGTGSGRRPPTTCWCSRSRTGSSSWTCVHAAPATWS